MRNALVLLLALVCSTDAMGATYPNPREGDWTIPDFRFTSGETLAELRVHYTTIGPPTGIPILILHGTGRSGGIFLTNSFADEMFGPGQPLDATTHYIILPDAIGAGKSSKPSDGLKGKFPHYGYEDMVRAQYRLVTEHLGVRHLRLIIGGSMGGMHAWMWSEMYPDFMDGVMPLQCLPAEIAGINRMLRRVVIDSIRNDPEWKNGDYDKQPLGGLVSAQYGLLALFGDPVALYHQAPTRARADTAFDERIRQGVATADANDLLYQYEAAGDYSPSPSLDQVRTRVVAVNTADDPTNPPGLGVMEREIARVPRGQYILIPRSDDTIGHGSYLVGKLYKPYIADLSSAP